MGNACGRSNLQYTCTSEQSRCVPSQSCWQLRQYDLWRSSKRNCFPESERITCRWCVTAIQHYIDNTVISQILTYQKLRAGVCTCKVEVDGSLITDGTCVINFKLTNNRRAKVIDRSQLCLSTHRKFISQSTSHNLTIFSNSQSAPSHQCINSSIVESQDAITYFQRALDVTQLADGHLSCTALHEWSTS